jgi:hypothetical protein
MPSEEENRQPSYPKTLGQILDALPSQGNSDSMQSASAENLSITGAVAVMPAQIGKLPSETVLGKLRNIAQNVSGGRLMDDQELEMSLAQHFGSRLECKKKLDHSYGADGGYNSKVIGNEATVDRLDDCEMKLFDAIEFLNRPASPQFVAGKLAQLRAVMARASESQSDIEIVIATYTDHIRGYPADIVAYAIDRCIHTKKWFPLVSELCREMEDLVSFRRAILRCFEGARNPLLARKAEAKRIAADPRLEMSHRELEKKHWLNCHWRWYVEDAEHMAQLNRDNGRMTQADEWQVIAEKRQAEHAQHRSS